MTTVSLGSWEEFPRRRSRSGENLIARVRIRQVLELANLRVQVRLGSENEVRNVALRADEVLRAAVAGPQRLVFVEDGLQVVMHGAVLPSAWGHHGGHILHGLSMGLQKIIFGLGDRLTNFRHSRQSRQMIIDKFLLLVDISGVNSSVEASYGDNAAFFAH